MLNLTSERQDRLQEMYDYWVYLCIKSDTCLIVKHCNKDTQFCIVDLEGEVAVFSQFGNRPHLYIKNKCNIYISKLTANELEHSFGVELYKKLTNVNTITDCSLVEFLKPVQ